MCRHLSRALLALTILLGLAGTAIAQTLTGDFAEGSGTSPTVSHTFTAGRGQFALVTASEDVTCGTPSGWTADQSISVFSAQRYCSFYVLSATGSESTAFTLSATANWTITIWQASVGFSSLRTSVATAENSDPTSTDPVSVVAGDLVIAGMGNEVAFVGTAPPSGYTHPTPSGASGPHYGTNTVMMGSIAYRVAPTTTTEDPTWDVDQPVFAGNGVHVFVPAASGGGSISTLLGFGR